jgi:hypothetical protein
MVRILIEIEDFFGMSWRGSLFVGGVVVCSGRFQYNSVPQQKIRFC